MVMNANVKTFPGIWIIIIKAAEKTTEIILQIFTYENIYLVFLIR